MMQLKRDIWILFGLICFALVLILGFFNLLSGNLGQTPWYSPAHYSVLSWVTWALGIAGFFILFKAHRARRPASPKDNDENSAELKYPGWFWPFYILIVAIAFLAGGSKFSQSETGLTFSWNSSQAVLLLPVLLLIPFLLKAIAKGGGFFELWGFKAQINSVREKAENADGKATNVSKDLENAIADLYSRIAELEKKKKRPVDRTRTPVSKPEDEFLFMVEELANQYRGARLIYDAPKRSEIDQKVKTLPEMTLDEILGLKKFTPEHEMVEALLLRRFAHDPLNAVRAFEQLVDLATSGRNSLVRYRAALSLSDRIWLETIPIDLRRQAAEKLNQRAEKEPNEPTAKQLWDVVINIV